MPSLWTPRPKRARPRRTNTSRVAPTPLRPSDTHRARARSRRARPANRWNTLRPPRRACRGTRRPRTTNSVRWTKRQGHKCSRGFAHRRGAPSTRDPARCSFSLAEAGSSDTRVRSIPLPDRRSLPSRSSSPRVLSRVDTWDTRRSRSRRSRRSPARRRREPMLGPCFVEDRATLSPLPEGTTPGTARRARYFS
jgi:hypothetical protein